MKSIKAHKIVNIIFILSAVSVVSTFVGYVSGGYKICIGYGLSTDEIWPTCLMFAAFGVFLNSLFTGICFKTLLNQIE